MRTWNAIRNLRSVERELERRIEKASEVLAGDGRLYSAAKRGKASRHPMWGRFMEFASPVIEARQHVEFSRESLERAAEHQITSAVMNLKQRRG